MLKNKKFWGIIFSLFFLWLALRKIDLQAIPKHLSSINPYFIILIILSYTLELLTRSYRWILIQKSDKLNFYQSFVGIVLTFFFNNTLPARAGEFFKPIYYSQKGIAESGNTLGAVVLERFFDGVMVLLLILVSFQRFSNNDMLRKAGFITAFFYFIIFIAILLAIFKREIFDKIIGIFLKLFPDKISVVIKNISNKFADSLMTIKNLKSLFNIFFSSIICWASSALTIWICFKSFGFQDAFLDSTFLLTVLSISSMIPASPGTLGIYEYFCILIFNSILGHSKEDGAAFAIVMHSLTYFYILIVGFIIISLEGLKIKEFIPSGKTEITNQ